MRKYLIACFIFITILLYSLNSFAQWIQSDGPNGDFISTIVENTHTQSLFVLTGSTGIYRLKKNNNTWENIWNNFPGLSYLNLAISDSVLFLGTTSNYILRSVNDGYSWDTISVDSTSFSFSHYNVVVTSDSLLFVHRYSKIYISYDKGNSFTQITTPNPSVNPISTLLYFNNRLFIQYQSKIYFSDDLGQTWQNPNINIEYGGRFRVTGNKIFVIGYPDIYETSDNGLNWIKISDNIFGVDHYHDINVKGDTILLTTNKGIYRSVDQANSFIKLNINFEFTNFYVNDIFFYDTNKLLIGTNYGIFSSLNYGNSWIEFNNGILCPDISGITSIKNEIFVCTYSYGIFSSDDNEKSWFRRNDGIKDNINNNFIILLDITSINNRIILGTGDHHLFYSDDKGHSWLNVIGQTYDDIFKFVKDNNNNIFSIPGGIYYSQDYGSSWNEIPTDNSCKNAIGLLVMDSLIIYSTRCYNQFQSIFYHRILRSTNLGNSFDTVHNSVSLSDIVMLDSLIIGAGSFVHLYRSTDYGVTWVIDSTFGNSKISNIIISKDKYIFLAAANEIYFSADTGITWQNITENFKGYINKVFIKNHFMYVTTSTTGLWKTDISHLIGKEESLSNNINIYPNPSDDFFYLNISDEDKVISNSYLLIFNALGQLLKRINIHSHFEGFSLKDYSDGIFFIHLVTNNRLEAIKVIKYSR